MNSGIPRRLIHIWVPPDKGSDLPLLSKAAVANLRLLNPNFEYLFMNDAKIEEFIDEHFPEYRSVFDSFDYPIQRFDFFRYLAVYHFGGFYFDLDVFLAHGLEDLLGFSCVFPFEELTTNSFLRDEYGMDWEIGNYAFGAVAGHPFIHAIIENCVRAQRDPEWVEPMMRVIPRLFHEEYFVFNTTGPGLISRTLAEYPDAAKRVKVLFPKNICDQTSWHCFGAYGVHLMAGTWLRKRGFLRRRLARVWRLRARKKFLKQGVRHFESRSLEFKRKV